MGAGTPAALTTSSPSSQICGGNVDQHYFLRSDADSKQCDSTSCTFDATSSTDKDTCCLLACLPPAASDEIQFLVQPNWNTVLLQGRNYPAGGADWQSSPAGGSVTWQCNSTAYVGTAEFRCLGSGQNIQTRGCDPRCQCDNGTVTHDDCPLPFAKRCGSCTEPDAYQPRDGPSVSATYEYNGQTHDVSEIRCWARCSHVNCSAFTGHSTTSLPSYYQPKRANGPDDTTPVEYCSHERPGSFQMDCKSSCCQHACRTPPPSATVGYAIDYANVLRHPTLYPGSTNNNDNYWDNEYTMCATDYHSEYAHGRAEMRCTGGGADAQLRGCIPTCRCTEDDAPWAVLGVAEQDTSKCPGPTKQRCQSCGTVGGGTYEYYPEGTTTSSSGTTEVKCWASCQSISTCKDYPPELDGANGCNFNDSNGNWFQDLYPAPANNLCSQSEQMYDQQSCRTGCCVQGCSAPADPGYGQDSPFDVNWPMALHSSQLYPGASSSGVTSWNASWGHGCRAGFFGTPAFECQEQGETVIATGCTDNCQSIKDDASLCYSRGYGDAMLAHERRAYFSDAHVAAEPQAGALSPEQCCKKGDRCGGMFLYDGKQNISVVEGIALRASEYCASRGFGQPIANLTTLVPTSNASEKEAECCELPTCDIGFFDAPKSHTCPGRLDEQDSVQPPTGFVGHSVEGSSKTGDEDVCTTRACDTDPMDLLQCCEQRGVCPNYYEGSLDITPDLFHIQTSSYFRKEYQVSAQTVAPAHFDCHRDAVLMEGVLDLWISSDAVLNYCAGRYCDGAIDLGTCCVPYEQHSPFNETVPLAEAVNLTTIQPLNTTTLASTLTVKRFYYCDDAFTPEYFWSAHQAWVTCNECGVYSEDLGAVHPEEEEEEEAPVAAKVNGQTSGNGSNVTTSELPLTADLIHSHAGPHTVSDDVSGLFETDRQFSASINLDHIGTAAPLVDDFSQQMKLREIFLRHLRKRILREQHEVHGLNAMTDDSVVVHVADVVHVEVAGAAAEGGAASLMQQTNNTGEDDDTTNTTGDDEGPVQQQTAPSSSGSDGGPASWCDLRFEPPDFSFQEIIVMLACGEAVCLVFLVLFVMRHRILNFYRGTVQMEVQQANKNKATGAKRAIAKVEKKKTTLPAAADKIKGKGADKVIEKMELETEIQS
eukprot:g6471.t1